MVAKGKILVIDDELGIREGCRRALQPQGFIVKTVATVREGLHSIQEDEFDLVLLDVMLPDGRGVDLIDPIREKDPEIVCVIITGYATVELAVQAIKLGAYDFISKPFTSDMLLITVNQGLEKRRLSLETKRLQAIEQHAAEIAREKEEMERLDRFKSAFTTLVAHELRSPVGSALSLLRTLIRGLAGGLNENQVDILKRIEARLNILLELINDLLSLAASKTIEPDEPLERIPLRSLIEKAVEHFSIEAESKQVALNLEAPREEIFVMATEDGLETLISNLISNAIKYTPAGGKIKVRAENQNKKVLVSVSDNGIGIPEDDLPRLWEEFFRAKNARRSGITGTGLGLSIVKQHVDRFNGSIDVQSKVGEGTTFSLLLPSA